MATYSYSIVSDTQNSLLNTDTLVISVEASTISPTLNNISTDGDSLNITFGAALSTEEQTTLTGIINNHSGDPTPEDIAPQEVKVVQEVASAPFAAKVLSDGRKLFKRVHGVFGNVPANSTADIDFIVPYTQAKINGLEILGASHGDSANFLVLDSAMGMITTVPFYQLNQFGFDVCMRKDFHVEESQYDADVYGGMVLRLQFTNSTNDNKSVGANFILHELV